MSHDPITYRELHGFLLGLGFDRQVAEHRLVYEHSRSNTLIVLADRNESDRVREADVISIQKQLIDHGLVSDTELASFLHFATRPTG